MGEFTHTANIVLWRRMNRRELLTLLLAALPAARIVAGGPSTVRNARQLPAPVAPSFGSEPLARFLVLGDWGTAGSLQKKIAASMERIASEAGGITAVISTGDNIYPNGVDSADDPQWKRKFADIYTGRHLQVPWWAVLGNHDYRKNVDAQVEYGKRDTRWHMPARYYRTEIEIDAETKLAVFALDTQAILQRTEGWKEQVQWLRKSLEGEKAAWKIVVGHHPLRSAGAYGDQAWMITHIKPLLDRYGVAMYLCGHDHDLQVIAHPSDTFLCVVSGAGGGARDTAFGDHSLFAATNGGFAMLSVTPRRAAIAMYDADGTLRFVHERKV